MQPLLMFFKIAHMRLPILIYRGAETSLKLTRKPEEYKVGEILKLTEVDLAPVSCLECDAKECKRSGECRTLPMWAKLYDIINDYLEAVTVADLMRTEE